MTEINFRSDQKFNKNQIFIIDDPEKGYPVTPCMDVYKSKTQYGGSLDKIKLILVVRGDMKNKKMIRDIRAPIATMRTPRYFLANDSNKK